MSEFAHYINIYGLAVVVLLLLPNIFWKLGGGSGDSGGSRALGVAEQVGRYGCMFFMLANWPVQSAWSSNESFAFWLIAAAALVAAYWLCWLLRPRWRAATPLLAIVPSVLFVFCGVMMNNLPLVLCALFFAGAHITLTIRGSRDSR